MAIYSASGTKISIGTTLAADTVEEFEADSYVEIKEVETIGDFGNEAALTNFSAIGDARVRKLKGAFDSGNAQITCGRDPADAGQIAVKAALATKFEYNIKVEFPDKPNPTGQNSIVYFRALVSSGRNSVGGNADVLKTVFQLAINTQLYEVPATPGS